MKTRYENNVKKTGIQLKYKKTSKSDRKKEEQKTRSKF